MWTMYQKKSVSLIEKNCSLAYNSLCKFVVNSNNIWSKKIKLNWYFELEAFSYLILVGYFSCEPTGFTFSSSPVTNYNYHKFLFVKIKNTHQLKFLPR